MIIYHHHNSYTSDVISSFSPTTIQSNLVPHIPHTSTTPYIPPIPHKLQLNNIICNFSLVIEHFKPSDMNNYFMSYILTHMLLPKIYISIVSFKNYIEIIQFSKKSFHNIFFSRFSFIK